MLGYLSPDIICSEKWEYSSRKTVSVEEQMIQNNTDTGGAITAVWKCWNALLPVIWKGIAYTYQQKVDCLHKTAQVIPHSKYWSTKQRILQESIVISVFFFFFLYFIVFICKLYKGQAKRYYNVGLNNFYIKRIHTKRKKKNRRKKRKEREVKKASSLCFGWLS